MPYFLLTFGDVSRPPVGVVIIEDPPMSQARMTAVVWRFAPGVPFGECHVLSPKMMASIPPTLIGKMMSSAEAEQLFPGDRAQSFGSQRCGNLHNVVAPLVGHNDAPSIAVPPPKGLRYSLGLAPSRAVIKQDVASLIRDQLAAFRAAFKMEKIPRHGVTIRPPR